MSRVISKTLKVKRTGLCAVMLKGCQCGCREVDLLSVCVTYVHTTQHVGTTVAAEFPV